MTRTNARRMMGIAAFVMLSIAGAAGQSNNAPAAGSALRDPQLAQRALALRGDLKSLKADPRTDVVLPDVSVALGKEKGRAVSIKGTFAKGAKGNQDQSYFWTIDLRRGTYRIFNLSDAVSGPGADAERIHAHLKSLGSDVTVTQLWQQLSERQLRLGERKQLLQQESRIDRQAAPSGKGGFSGEMNLEGYYCFGNMTAGIQGWEPFRWVFNVLHLTETAATANFARSNGNWGWAGIAGCWANPETFVYTTWYVTACRPAASPWLDGYLDFSTWGEYINWDFFWDVIPTYIYQQAAVNYSGGIGIPGARSTTMRASSPGSLWESATRTATAVARIDVIGASRRFGVLSDRPGRMR